MISKIKKIFKGITRKYRKYKRQKRLVRDAIRVLKRSEPYKQNEDYSLENYDVMYILENPQKSNNVWAFISYMCEEAYKFDVYKDNRCVFLWGYNFTRDLFDHLEDGYEISYMPLDCHYGVWEWILEGTEEEIKGSKGMQSYMRYCHKNKITYKKLQKKCNYCNDDIMKYYNTKC
ncbi:MAG: hypothetical protein HFE51_09840 [Clostridia bacterium]|nr:hypothetical protein [Clostridia bacterium]MCI8979420.1 hypothetical protein [Clostridia bacterium]MCI9086703.1 hypothetical protein [Clostridia bacterium]NDO20306.1 hypothetical protein [Lachnospiraceae bacterium MD329]